MPHPRLLPRVRRDGGPGCTPETAKLSVPALMMALFLPVLLIFGMVVLITFSGSIDRAGAVMRRELRPKGAAYREAHLNGSLHKEAEASKRELGKPIGSLSADLRLRATLLMREAALKEQLREVAEAKSACDRRIAEATQEAALPTPPSLIPHPPSPLPLSR